MIEKTQNKFYEVTCNLFIKESSLDILKAKCILKIQESDLMVDFDATLDTDKKNGDLQDELEKIFQRAVHQE